LSINIPLKRHIWKIAAIGLGLVISILIIFIMQFINMALYPVPDGIQLSDIIQYEQFILDHPVFLAGILFSNATGSFTGGAIARMTHPSVTVWMAGWVGLVLFLLDLYNLISVAYPGWFWFITLIIYIPGAWLGAYITHLIRLNSQ
jgi:hypothetical protein